MTVHRIDGTSGSQRTDPLARPNASRPKDAAVRADSGERDRVELSSRARLVATLSEASQGLPDVREDLVREIRSAVENGTYEVDPRALARSILEFEDDLGR